MPEVAFIIAGPKRKGEPPPLEKLGKGAPAAKHPGKPMIEIEAEGEQGGQMNQAEAGFWSEAAPHICDTCAHRQDSGCAKVAGVDFDECDQTLSGCREWEGGGEMETEPDEDEETEETAA